MPRLETGTQDRGGSARPSAAAPIRWTARLSRSKHKYHRVEIAGAGPEEPPIALVQDPQHAEAIAELHEVVRKLVHHETYPPDLWQLAKAALAKADAR